MSQSQKHKIMIVGAGIAGLTAALCLRQSGHDVTILEQASALQDIGAGIQLSPNALHVLNAIGIGDKLACVAFLEESKHAGNTSRIAELQKVVNVFGKKPSSSSTGE